MKVLALVQLFMLGSFSSFAQDDKFGADPDKCKESVSLYREYYKQKNYDDAMMGWRWAFANCPMATKNIVINGPKLIEHQIEKFKDDPVKRQAYIDTLMMVYDKRMELYPDDKAYVLGRKGMDMYEYAGDDYTDTYNTLKEAIKVGKLETEANAILRLYQAGMKQLIANALEMDVLYDLYDEVSEVIEHNLAKGEEDKSHKYYVKAQQVVDQNFERIAKEEQYIELMKPKVDANPNDAALLEKVTNMMVKRKWTSNPFYLDASEKLYKLSPSTTAAYNLYEGHAKKGNSAEAAKFLKESIKLETDKNEKADKLLKLAKQQGSENQYSAARTTANEAAALRSGWGAPYMFIGSLYLSTANSCGSDDCSRGYGIWAAEDMFIKAKSVDGSLASEASGKIATCKKYYPTVKQCFFGGIENGAKVTVGGWIGVETTARFVE